MKKTLTPKEVEPKGSEKTESVIETPSAADITAALEALGQDSEETDVSLNNPKEGLRPSRRQRCNKKVMFCQGSLRR